MKALLVLEDGAYFEGESFGVSQEVIGWVSFNTGVVGYQELITDPANYGKILVLTYPLIGNYGINEKFNESGKAWVSGLVVKEPSLIYSNWQAKLSLEKFLKKQKVVGISGIDTRTLAVKIRHDGEMMGIISSAGDSVKELLKKLREFKKRQKESVLDKVSVKKVTIFKGKGDRIVVIDLGLLKGILRQLLELGLEVILVPYDTKPEEILKLKPKGLIISNGPEDDPQLSKVIDTIKQILGKLSLLGISAGHLVISKAVGAKVKRMKLGHHGLNYPVQNPNSLKAEITVQNHSFAVDEDSLDKKDIEIMEKNINDMTSEKIRSKKFKFISIQYYPLSPGLNEAHPVFREFIKILKI